MFNLLLANIYNWNIKANDWGIWTSFFETSAKLEVNENKCFEEIINIVREYKYNQTLTKENKNKNKHCNCVIQ